MISFPLRLSGCAALVSALVLVLSSCGGGGGGTSAGVGGGGAGGVSSTLVINLGGGGFSMLQDSDEEASLVARISKLLVSDAWAQLDNVKIFINGVETPATVIDGVAYIALPPGDYVVCVGAAGDPTVDPNCQAVSVGPDQIVVINGTVDPTTEEVTLDDVAVENAEDIVVVFQDPDKANKTLVCHKQRMTISVGTPAALNGHLTHGDSLGPCPEFAQDPANDDPDADTQSANKGNNGNGNGKNKEKGNNGNRGNKPT